MIVFWNKGNAKKAKFNGVFIDIRPGKNIIADFDSQLKNLINNDDDLTATEPKPVVVEKPKKIEVKKPTVKADVKVAPKEAKEKE